MMELNSRVKDYSHQQLEPEQDRSSSCRHNRGNPSFKQPHRTKREALKDKKKAKGKTLPSDQPDTDHLSTRPREDEAGSVASQDSSIFSTSVLPTSSPNSLTPNIAKLVTRPPYLQIRGCRTLVGNLGHCSAIFRRPVLEGSCFMEFKLKEDAKKDKPCSYPSAARVGLCLPSFDTGFPLGCGHSIGYKSADGSIVSQNSKIGKGEPWKSGDVIGVCVRARPPRKHPEAEMCEEGSVLQFFRNGKLVFEFGELRQEFYCFGVSLYNFSQIEVVCRSEGTFSTYKGRHYLSTLDEKVPYQDLSVSKLFKL